MKKWMVGLLGLAIAQTMACGSQPYEEETPAAEAPGTTTGAPLTVCLPRALAHEPMRPELPLGWGTACRLRRTADDQDGDGTPEQVVDYENQGGTTHAVHRANGRVSAEQQLERDEAGRLVRASQSSGTYGWSYAWQYDAEGHLLREHRQSSSPYGGESESVVAQAWTAGRLTTRTESERGHVTQRTEWQYDDAGRLVRARALHPESGAELRTTTWTYDALGRPEIWTRIAEAGRIVLRFAYDPNGVVRTRSVQSNQRATYTYATESNRFDQYSLGPYEAAPREEGCAPLPVALAYGYPATEAIYGLAYENLAEDSMLTSLYTAGQGFYSYGTAEAFGHTGFLTPYEAPLAAALSANDLTVETTYDEAGRMTREVVVGGQVRAVRQRTLDAGRIVRDDLEMSEPPRGGPTGGSPAGAPAFARTLTFTYGAGGGLVARTLSDAEGDLLLHQWTRDARNRPTTHTVEGTARARQVGLGESRLKLQRRYDEAGRVVLDAAERPASGRDEAVRFLRARGYDEAGHLTLEATENLGMRSETRTTFDAQGLVTLTTSRHRALTQTDWQSEYREETERNALGLPTRQTSRSQSRTARGAVTSTRVKTLAYDCAR